MNRRLLIAALLLGLSSQLGLAGTFVYVHERSTANGSKIVVATVPKNKDGLVAEAPTLTVTAGAATAEVAGNFNTLGYSKRRKMLFAGATDGIATFSIAENGSLTSVATGIGGADILGIAVIDHDEKTFVYGADHVNGQIVGYEVKASGQLVALGGQFPFGLGGMSDPRWIQIANERVLVLCEGSDQLFSHKISPNGQWSSGVVSPVPNTGTLADLALSDDATRCVVLCSNTMHTFERPNDSTLSYVGFYNWYFAPYRSLALAKGDKFFVTRDEDDDSDVDLVMLKLNKQGDVEGLRTLAQGTFLNTPELIAMNSKRDHIAMASADDDRVYYGSFDAKTGAVQVLPGFASMSLGVINGMVVVDR